MGLREVELQIVQGERALRHAEEEGRGYEAIHLDHWLDRLYQLREDLIGAECVTVTEFGVLFE